MEEDPYDKAAAAIKIKVDNMVIVDDNYETEGTANPGKKRMFREDSEFKLKKGDNKVHHCQRSDCKNERKEGHYLCDHHSSMLKSYNNTNGTCIPTSPSTKKPEKAIAPGTRRGRAKAAKKGQSSSSNPYEFYYYSGFGPLWGKRRGDRGEANKNESKETEINGSVAAVAATHYNTTPFSTPSPIEHHEELDLLDEDDDDDDEDSDDNGDIGKKRMRKPVKARSLKSLM